MRSFSPMDPESTYLTRSLWRFLDVFVLAMLLFALWRTPSVGAVLVGGAFAVTYVWGSITGRRALLSTDGPDLPSQSPDSRTQVRINLWLALVIGLWAVLAFIAPDASYLSFPLFFVVMHVASGKLGYLAVVAMTATAVVALAFHHGWTTGGVLGPVIGGAVALAVGFGFHLLLVESHARAQAILELKSARADIADMSRRAGETAERNRLAADIHDTVAQGLTSVQLLLHAAERDLEGSGEESALGRIRLARETAGHNLAETRRILRELQPAPLTESGLPVTLARVCSITGLPDNTVEFSVTGTPRPLPERTEETVVRVTQSLLGNVVKHAGAGHCSVTLDYRDSAVRLSVIDDGAGFDPTADTSEESMGLDIAHRRAADIGGRLTLDSAPGDGCRATLYVPDPTPATGA